jgi:hypothetical protein
MYNTFRAVQRCPLNDKVPAIHSLIARSRSASGSIIAGFWPEPLKLNAIYFLLVLPCKAIADLLLPIKANTVTFHENASTLSLTTFLSR